MTTDIKSSKGQTLLLTLIHGSTAIAANGKDCKYQRTLRLNVKNIR